MFKCLYEGRRVLITGHTGFKGSWLALWLQQLGAEVVGFALRPPSKASHYRLLNLDITSITGDIRNQKFVLETFKKYKPEIVFHLAAQTLVRYSYDHPAEPFEINVMGTINVLEACRNSESVKAIVNVTSDKVYKNNEWMWGYREIDPIGGYDPYSCSKGCSELITASYRKSFFNNKKSGAQLIATARSGNVIGGGDWARDRLIPDIMRAAAEGRPVIIRNPLATRPWQHVLESLSGYLLLGQKLMEGSEKYAEAWNFGNSYGEVRTVEDIVKQIQMYWRNVRYKVVRNKNDVHEAILLKLDSLKAQEKLHWTPVWNIEKSIEMTVRWYKEYYTNKTVTSLENLNEYLRDALKGNAVWL